MRLPRRNQHSHASRHLRLMVPTLFAGLALAPWALAAEPAARAARSSMEALQVACVQLETQADLEANTRAIIAALEAEAGQGTRLVVFSECALTTYDATIVRKLTQDQIDRALEAIGQACRRLDLYAVVGSAYYADGRRYNGAFVFDPSGRLVKRYAKLHVVQPDLFENGRELAIFYIDDVPTTIMICHDERYPEIFRIPVLAGAKLGIYISLESKEPLQKLDNYRSQIMARAVENQITVIQCNAGDGGPDGGSHGHSRIIDPHGRILVEAGSGVGESIRTIIRPRDSSNNYARAGAASPALKAFWAEGLRVLREQNPEYFQPQNLKAALPASPASP